MDNQNYAYSQPQNYQQQNYAPTIQLRTNRGLLKMILLSLITFGIYGLVVWCHLSEEINTVIHRYCSRLGNEVTRRGIDYRFGAGTFWGWGVLGSLLLGIGPLVFCHKLLKAANLMNESYNTYG